MIRAVYRDGNIEPLDHVPTDWQDGQVLIVESVADEPSAESFDQWAAEIKAATAGISDEDHDRLMAALAEVEAESKELGRREMERSRYIFADEPDAGVRRE